MGRPMGPKKVHRYSAEFKLTAVKLSGMRGVQVQTVAKALDIHPFMLSRWRKEALPFAHPAELARLVRTYMPYYNGVRMHSAIGYSSPIDYEARAT